jgi:sodium transport system permease protein
MSKIITIIKKELKRFFGDRRMLTTLIMPGLLIYIIYNLLGSFIGDALQVEEDYTYNVYVENLPDEYSNVFESEDYDIKLVEEEYTIEEVKSEITNKNIDLLVVFDDNFTSSVQQGLQPNVSIFYNATSTESSEIYNFVYTNLTFTSATINYNYFINADSDVDYNLATQEDMSAQVITMMLPYLLLIFLFTGCVAITSESIAGEKERGTINTLLVTPTKRSHIAIGKIIALSITSLVSASASFLGLLGSLPALLEGSGGDVTLSMYGPLTYGLLFAVMIVTLIFFTTILSIVSTLAKNVKESSQWSSVLMVIVMVLGVSSMAGMGNVPEDFKMYLIPVYNSVQCMSSIFALKINYVNILVTIVSNVIYIGAGVFLLAKMFNSEKIMSSN